MQRPLKRNIPPLRTTQGHLFDPFRLLSKNSNISKPLIGKKIKQNITINDENVNTNNLKYAVQKNQKVVGLTKRIKKISTIQKHPFSIRSTQLRQENKSPLCNPYVIKIEDKQFNCFPERLLNIPDEFRLMNHQHKQDNDCDSDWDQVEAGAMKLFKSLKESIQQRIQI